MWWFYLVMTQQTLNLSLGVCETPREWIIEGLVAKTAERKVSDTRVTEGTLIHRAIFLCVGVLVHMCAYHRVSVKVRGKISGVCSLFPPQGLQELNSICQAWLHMPLSSEPPSGLGMLSKIITITHFFLESLILCFLYSPDCYSSCFLAVLYCPCCAVGLRIHSCPLFLLNFKVFPESPTE